jgi:hypothetical protein
VWWHTPPLWDGWGGRESKAGLREKEAVVPGYHDNPIIIIITFLSHITCHPKLKHSCRRNVLPSADLKRRQQRVLPGQLLVSPSSPSAHVTPWYTQPSRHSRSGTNLSFFLLCFHWTPSASAITVVSQPLSWTILESYPLCGVIRPSADILSHAPRCEVSSG